MLEIKKDLDSAYLESLEDYNYLHNNPEWGFNLEKTSEYVYKVLKKVCLKPIKFGNNSIVCYIGDSEETVLFRADMDALKVGDECMHLCGHDIHTSILLGVARVLKNNVNKLNKKIKLVFQPAEELLQGAKYMVEKGVCDDVKEGYRLHVNLNSQIKNGTVIIPSGGIIAPSSNYFEICINGKESHGAMVEKGINAVSVGNVFLNLLNNYITNEKPLNEESLVSITSFISNDSYNIVPSKAIIKGSIRCYSEEVFNRIINRMNEIIKFLDECYKTSSSLKIVDSCPVLINDFKVREKVVKKLKNSDLNIIDVSVESKSTGSEDFSYFSRKIPTLMVALNSKSDEFPLHHKNVKINKEIIYQGILYFCLIAIR